MPKAVVAFWNCVMSEDWFELTMSQRLQKLKAAVVASDVQGGAKVPRGGRHAIQTIFVAPEYAFSKECLGDDQRIPLPALHTDRVGVELWAKTIRNLGFAYPHILFVPGTVAFATAGLGRNRCMFAHGNKRHVFDKKNPVGEVVVGGDLKFAPGTGFDIYRQDGENGNRFLMHICRDAIVETGRGEADIHIVVGQGVGRWKKEGDGDKAHFISKQAGKLLIVADCGSYEVYDYRTGISLPAFFNSKVEACDLHCYEVDL